ncbi:peptidylprolyl isomerase [Lampropedia puyangensis]|uniref:Peptidyl-prolyl cis-trans isomerase n=1 Tax=Lampropedia puyangensis TaxID=1330072 RepID=A0A4S8F748_9BURK|nr:FKBP-type peptidyl-prolyl cis-trans isomerase [Lampropedia puyangensis]THU02054.1 peptidylprolyl isomerase [Lampropedia puyangensis]
MEIMKQTVVALTWAMKDSLGEELDTLEEPVEFYVGGEDLLPSIEAALLGKREGEQVALYLEPEHAFGDYDENLVFLEARSLFPEEMEEGMVLEGRSLPEGAQSEVDNDLLLTVTEMYPEHVVLDGNHPLAGISLQLTVHIHSVRPSTVDEQRRGSTGIGFFKISPDEELKPPTLH